MTPIRQIIGSTRDYNLHSHTQFCDGRAPMESMAAAAVAAGMRHYGFTPHSPVPVNSPCNMQADRVEEYLAEFTRLKHMFEGRINLYVSMEIDFLDTWGAFNDYFQSLPLDYRLSSVHFIPSLVNPGLEVDVDGRPSRFALKMKEEFDGDIRYVVDRFYSRTLHMIEKGGFDMLGHFDKIGFNATSYCPGVENEPWYRRHIENVIEAVRYGNSDLVVEVNTKAILPNIDAKPEDVALHRPRIFPQPWIVERLLKAGIPLAVNSDAHFPERVTAGRAEAFKIIDSVRV